MRRVLLSLMLAVACSSGGCIFPRMALKTGSDKISLASADPDLKTIYVVGHGWHTGIVVRPSDVSPRVWPEILDYVDDDFVEAGWGDEGFYRAERITIPITAKALFWPTPSVMHLAGFRGPPSEFYPASDIIQLDLTESEFKSLCTHIAATFDHGADGGELPLGPGLYGHSQFYRAKGSYYLPKTCNVWTARGLKAAGQHVSVERSVMADGVISQVQRLGTVIRQSPRGLKQAVLFSPSSAD